MSELTAKEYQWLNEHTVHYKRTADGITIMLRSGLRISGENFKDVVTRGMNIKKHVEGTPHPPITRE